MSKSKSLLVIVTRGLSGLFSSSFWYLISNTIPVIREQTQYDFNTFRLQNVCTLFYVVGYVPGSASLKSMGTWIEFVSCCWVKCISLNYIELVHSAFRVFCIFLHFCLLIF